MITAAAAPMPIPAAAPLASPEDVLVLGVDVGIDVALMEDVGADVEGVVDAGTGEDVEDVNDEDDEVVLATTL